MEVQHDYLLSTAQIFTVLLVMLGPFRLLGPFALVTAGMGKQERSKLAFQSTLISMIAVVSAGLIGRFLLHKWGVSPVFLLLGSGIILFLVALRPLVVNTPEQSAMQNTSISAADVAIHLVITTYGVASFIVMLSAGHDLERSISIVVCLAVVMTLNIFAMIYGNSILKVIGTLPLKILGTSLGTLQLALSLKIIFNSLKLLIG